jgi:hypothetical protein
MIPHLKISNPLAEAASSRITIAIEISSTTTSLIMRAVLALFLGVVAVAAVAVKPKEQAVAVLAPSTTDLASTAGFDGEMDISHFNVGTKVCSLFKF